MFMRLSLAILALAGALDAAAQSCGSRLFLSGFNSTVHVFDACTGAYIRNLDANTRLRGAMAVRLGPDGLIYVVTETGAAIHKYRNDTLEYAGVYVNVPNIGATGLAFDPAGVAYVASYQNSTAYRFDRAGQGLGAAFPPLASGLRGRGQRNDLRPGRQPLRPGVRQRQRHSLESGDRSDERRGGDGHRRASPSRAASCPPATTSTCSSRAKDPAACSSGTSRAAPSASSPRGWCRRGASTTRPTASSW
jgi:hypothetical protein